MTELEESVFLRNLLIQLRNMTCPVVRTSSPPASKLEACFLPGCKLVTNEKVKNKITFFKHKLFLWKLSKET